MQWVVLNDKYFLSVWLYKIFDSVYKDGMLAAELDLEHWCQQTRIIKLVNSTTTNNRQETTRNYLGKTVPIQQNTVHCRVVNGKLETLLNVVTQNPVVMSKVKMMIENCLLKSIFHYKPYNYEKLVYWVIYYNNFNKIKKIKQRKATDCSRQVVTLSEIWFHWWLLSSCFPP